MTVKELMDFLKECPEDAVIHLKDTDSAEHCIGEICGFFDDDSKVVNFYIT